MICISFLCSIDKLSFPSFSIFSFLLQLPISFSVSQIIKEPCPSSSSYSFHFRHLFFNGIMKKVIYPQSMTNPIGFSTQDIIWKCPLLSYTDRIVLIEITTKKLQLSKFLGMFGVPLFYTQAENSSLAGNATSATLVMASSKHHAPNRFSMCLEQYENKQIIFLRNLRLC